MYHGWASISNLPLHHPLLFEEFRWISNLKIMKRISLRWHNYVHEGKNTRIKLGWIFHRKYSGIISLRQNTWRNIFFIVITVHGPFNEVKCERFHNLTIFVTYEMLSVMKRLRNRHMHLLKETYYYITNAVSDGNRSASGWAGPGFNHRRGSKF